MPTAIPPAGAARLALSKPRLRTYEAAARNTAHALELYAWNARVASALMVPAHFAEVSTRNAVDDALTRVYGPRWPWEVGFERSLSPRRHGYSQLDDLLSTRRKFSSTGKVVADLAFAFWQKMFTVPHDGRIWNPHILAVFPAATGLTPAALRVRLYDDLETIRKLRNRMAHHEPIFSRALADDLIKMVDLVNLRSPDTATWVRSIEDVSTVLAARPR